MRSTSFLLDVLLVYEGDKVDRGVEAGVSHSALVTGRCHCRGSEDDERRLRCRYTSVP